MKYQITPLSKPVNKTIAIPSSKSLTNRALILAALTKSKVKIINPLNCDDTKAMLDCLNTLSKKSTLFNLNAKLSGTTVRFILALSCLVPGQKKIYADEGLNKRPIKELVEGLRQLGAEIEYLKEKGFPPVLVSSSTLKSGTLKIRGDISSQYLSALLMISPIVGDIKIKVTSEQISKPYVDLTLDLMKKFGVFVVNKNYQEYFIKKQNYKATKYSVEGDYSSAAYFFAIAILTSSNITLKNLNPKSKQADLEFIKILEKMGSKIKPLNVNMTNCPDQIQTMAVLLSFAKGQSKITGIKSLRIKETDRVAAIKAELSKMGIKTNSNENILTIEGGNPHGAEIKTYGDHRMAMSFAVAGLKIPGIIIKNPEVISKTYPNFWKDFRKITEVKNVS